MKKLFLNFSLGLPPVGGISPKRDGAFQNDKEQNLSPKSSMKKLLVTIMAVLVGVSAFAQGK